MIDTKKNGIAPPQQALKRSEDVTALRRMIGPLRTWSVNRQVGRAAATAVERLEEARIQSIENIGMTGIAIVDATVRAGMVGQALPALGTLAANMNANAAVVDSCLSSGAAAEEKAHLENRRETIGTFQEMQAQGAITDRELDQCIAHAVEDAEADIHASRQRMARAKSVVGELHEHGLGTVIGAKARLS